MHKESKGYTRHVKSFLILTGGFALMFVTLGTVQSFGVLYSELLDHFQSGKGETGWVASLSSGLMLAFGPVAGALQQKFGCRKIAITGCLITACGMLGSAFVSSLYLLYLTYGVICGIGFSLSHQAANVAIPIHFDKRRSLAMAITSSGGSVGTITTPLLTSWFLTENSWQGTFILLSCLSVQAVVFAAFFHTQDHEVNDTSDSDEKPMSCTENVKILFRNINFNLFVTSGFFVAMGYFIPYILISDFAKHRGIEGNDAALLITTAGVSGLLGRIVVGLVADLPVINRCALNGIVLIAGGISTISCSYIYQFTLFIAYAAFVGVFTGTFAFLQSVIATDICGKQQLNMAFGFLVFFQGIAVMIGPPIAGWISDSTGQYNEAFYYGGGLFILGGLFSLLVPLHIHCCQNRKRKKYELEAINS